MFLFSKESLVCADLMTMSLALGLAGLVGLVLGAVVACSCTTTWSRSSYQRGVEEGARRERELLPHHLFLD